MPEAEEALFNVSQALLDDAVQANVPGPVLVMVRDWAAGLDPFCTAENEKTLGLRVSVGVTTVGSGSSS